MYKRNYWFDVNDILPPIDEDVAVFNEKGKLFCCHLSNNPDVKTDEDGWCNYSGSDILFWTYLPNYKFE